MAMTVGERKGIVADMNVVPLIDILLVLIIIFMVITPTTPKGLSAVVPQPAAPAAVNPNTPDPTIVVQVAANGGLKINQDPVTWEDLGQRLDIIFKGRAEKVAFVKGEDNVSFADVARAIDIMRGSGIDKVGLISTAIKEHSHGNGSRRT